MLARLELGAGAAFASIQDQGRFGYQALGLSPSGAIDPRLMMLGNGLLGQDLTCAGLEYSRSKFEFICQSGAVNIVLAAHAKMRIDDKVYPSFAVTTVLAGQRVVIEAPSGHNYGFIAIEGGLDCPRIGGSYARHQRADLGLLLKEGRVLTSKPSKNPAVQKRFLRTAPELTAKTLRLCLGPQEQMFTQEALDNLLNQEFSVTHQADRMGLRLQGVALEHKAQAEIASEPIALGAMQVPANGQAIVMLSERQTTGGYAKIATLTALSCAQLAQTPAQSKVRFCAITPQEARAEYRAWQQEITRMLDQSALMGDLYNSNLISGAYLNESEQP